MRQFLLLLVSILLLGGSLTVTLGTVALRDFELRGYVDASKDFNIPYATPKPGVNVQLEQYDRQALLANLTRIQEANFHWVRQFVNWNEIEPRRREFDWSAWDRIATAMRAFPRLNLVAVLMNSPEWSRTNDSDRPSTETAPPDNLQDIAVFAQQFAARFGDVIDYYQIWDEPNLADAWGNRDPRPAEYVALLATTRDAILEVDPDATIIAAALAPTTEIAGRNISDIRFLDAMYQHGASAFMDVVAGKPYGFARSPFDREVDETILNFSRIIALREVMLAHDDGGTALWASNFGWNSLPQDWTGAPSIWGQVSADEQIDFALKAMDRSHREWPWLGAMILHQWQPMASAERSAMGLFPNSAGRIAIAALVGSAGLRSSAARPKWSLPSAERTQSLQWHLAIQRVGRGYRLARAKR